MHYIYKITNILSNKIYIGQTNNKRRWSQHRYFAKNPSQTGQYIHSAMAKHGIDNFKFEIIATCKTQDDANEVESILITQYSSRDSNYGYNLTVGGSHGGHSEKTKKKQSEATKRQIEEKGHPALGTKRTEEQRANLSAALKARDHEAIYNEEVRQKMSDAHKGKILPEEQKQKMAAAIKANWAIRIYYSRRCAAPVCDVSGKASYILVDGIRYCTLHGQRMRNTGSTELLSKTYRPMSEETKKKVSESKKGTPACNKIQFTEEQIQEIINDPRSNAELAKAMGRGRNLIQRIRTAAKRALES